MKWLYYIAYHNQSKAGPLLTAQQFCSQTYWMFENIGYIGYPHYLGWEGWIVALNADYSRGLKDVNFDDYDAFITANINYYKGINYPPLGHVRYLREKVGDRLIVSSIEPEEDFLNPIVKKEVEASNLILLPYNTVRSSSYFDRYFKTNKFIYIKNPVLNIENIKRYFSKRESKLFEVISSQQFRHPELVGNSDKVLKILCDLQKRRVKGTMIVRKSPGFQIGEPKVFGSMERIRKTLRFIKIVSNRIVGLFNFPGAGGIGLIGACVGTPFIGSNRAQIMKDLNPSCTFDENDYLGQASMLNRLLNDQSYYNELVTKNYELANKFTFSNCKDNLMKVLKERDLI